jgi:hydroxypyruvate isomerase
MGKFKQSFCIPCFWESEEAGPIRKAIEGAAKIGLPAVEIWFRDTPHFDLICQVAKDNGMRVASMCGHQSLTVGLNNPAEHDRIRAEILESIEVARKRDIPNLIVFSGNRRPGQSDQDAIGVIADGLAPIKKQIEASGVMLNLELLNSKVDHAGYQCDHTAWGVAVVKRVASPCVKLLYDIYHMQIMEGDLCRTIRDNIAHIGHFHTAGNPGRNDLDETQEIFYPAVIDTILATNYNGYVAHEFFAKGDKIEALGRAFRLCARG